MLAKLKIWAALAVSFLLSLLGLQHFRHKSKKLKRELEASQAAKRAGEAQSKALIEGQEEANRFVQKEIDNSSDKRDYFTRR